MTLIVTSFVRNCLVCQASKHETLVSPRHLQPLPIPQGVWMDILMDFIFGLPRSHGKDVIYGCC